MASGGWMNGGWMDGGGWRVVVRGWWMGGG